MRELSTLALACSSKRERFVDHVALCLWLTLIPLCLGGGDNVENSPTAVLRTVLGTCGVQCDSNQYSHDGYVFMAHLHRRDRDRARKKVVRRELTQGQPRHVCRSKWQASSDVVFPEVDDMNITVFTVFLTQLRSCNIRLSCRIEAAKHV